MGCKICPSWVISMTKMTIGWPTLATQGCFMADIGHIYIPSTRVTPLSLKMSKVGQCQGYTSLLLFWLSARSFPWRFKMADSVCLVVDCDVTIRCHSEPPPMSSTQRTKHFKGRSVWRLFTHLVTQFKIKKNIFLISSHQTCNIKHY